MFYHFRQNNSGGMFDDPAIHVIVEANSADHANERAAEIGIYFDGVDAGIDCECCGDRWSETWDGDADSEPLIYGTPIADADMSQFRWGSHTTAIVYHLSGDVTKYE